MLIFDAAAVLQKFTDCGLSELLIQLGPIRSNRFVERQDAFPSQRRDDHGAVRARHRPRSPDAIQDEGLLGFHIRESDCFRVNHPALENNRNRCPDAVASAGFGVNQFVESLLRRDCVLGQTRHQSYDRRGEPTQKTAFHHILLLSRESIRFDRRSRAYGGDDLIRTKFVAIRGDMCAICSVYSIKKR